MSLDEASEYFDRISAELPGYAQVLRDIKVSPFNRIAGDGFCGGGG